MEMSWEEDIVWQAKREKRETLKIRGLVR